MMTEVVGDACFKIGVCKMEGCKYHENVDLDDELMISVTKRMSFSRVFLRHSMAWMHDSLEKLPIRLTIKNLGIMSVILAILMPRAFTYMLVYPIFRLVFGTLYPAYASYKAVRTKNVKEYVKWMMYWIVFALFTCAETFTDVFFSFWFPFYYEIKIVLVLWLLSPATKGSSILYRRFVHPALSRREAEIDEALARATEQGYTAVLHLGSKGVNYATTVLMQTAIKGGGGLVQQLKKSYSLSDLSGEKEDENRNTSNSHDETDMEVEPRKRERVGRRGYSPRRTQSTNNRLEMYFSEVDVEVRQPRSKEPLVSLNNIRSSEDISSGYSSGEALHNHRSSIHSESLVRTASVGGRTRAKPRSTTKKAPEEEEEDSDNSLLYPDLQSLPNPLTSLNVEQALELVSLLSYHLARNNFINLNKDSLNDANLPKIEEENSKIKLVVSDEEQKENKADDSVKNSIQNEESIANEDSILKRNSPIPKIVIPGDEIETEISETVNKHLESNIDITKFTDEICKEKFDELKKILSDAHKAVSNIVSSQENLSSCETVENTPSEKNFSSTKSENDLMQTYGSISSLEVWSTPNVSRSNSNSELRAGKYHKKPAPRTPNAGCVENLEDFESQNAVKATLVIKTGSLKSFTDSMDSQKLKRKKTSKSRSKERFSKLLTVPKNFFHNAFHKDQKDKGRHDDSSSINSDCSDSESRSSSIGSQNTPTDDDTLTPSSDVEIDKSLSSVDQSKTEENINKDNDLNLQNENQLLKTDTKLDFSPTEGDKSDVTVTDELKAKEEKIENKGLESTGNSQTIRAKLRIREMSRSPNRCLKNNYFNE